jgi:hypothetical protein
VSLIKKIDVDAHFAARRAMRLGRMPMMCPPGAAAIRPCAPKKKTPAFKQDFVLEHSSLEDSSPNVLAASTPIASGAGQSRLLRPPRSRQE